MVITKNEEANLARCLASVRPLVREIVVVDSGSTDRTLEIARGFADRVIAQPWLGFGPQKQFAIDRAGEAWVLSIDADEALSGELAREIAGLEFDRDGYELPRPKYGHIWTADIASLEGEQPAPSGDGRGDRALHARAVHESVELQGTRARCRARSTTGRTATSPITRRRSTCSRRSPPSACSPRDGGRRGPTSRSSRASSFSVRTCSGAASSTARRD